MKDGILMREDVPAIYAYHQVFEYGGRPYTRRMFLTRLKLEPFSTGSVLPHEETFGGPKEDRLALMKATDANISPVFALYRDPAGVVNEALASPTSGQPDATGVLGGVQQRLWIVSDTAVIERVVRAFAQMTVYIADGHHRYITALNFRDWVAHGDRGPIAPDHPANYVMVALAGMDDPGSLILPTHRVLVDMGEMALDGLLSTWRDGCEKSAADAADMTLFHGPSGESVHVRFTNRTVLSSLEPDKSAPWRALDVAYLHRYLIDELLTPPTGDGGGVTIRYIKSQEDACSAAIEAKGIALICKPTTMAQLCAVSEAGDLMPQKSTYFYPKVATGLTINLLRE